MNLSIGERWEDFVQTVLKSGRYGSATEVVHEGLRLVEEREAKLKALQDSLNAAIAEVGHVTDDDVGDTLNATAERLRKEDF